MLGEVKNEEALSDQAMAAEERLAEVARRYAAAYDLAAIVSADEAIHAVAYNGLVELFDVLFDMVHEVATLQNAAHDAYHEARGEVCPHAEEEGSR